MDQQRPEFMSLFLSERDRLFRYILTLVPQISDAEDVFQETSQILWEKFDDFDTDRSFIAWGCGIAWKCARNHLRKRAGQPNCLRSELLAIIGAERQEDVEKVEDGREALRHCLTLLTDVQKDLVRQFYCLNLSAAEIADQFGKATQTVYNMLSATRRRLAECVTRHQAIDGEAFYGR